MKRLSIDNIKVGDIPLRKLPIRDVMRLAAYVAKRQRTLTPPFGQKKIRVDRMVVRTAAASSRAGKDQMVNGA
jgi:hypothetical protein